MSASAERKKKKEGFLARQAKAKNFDPISEEELLRKDDVAPDDVLRLNKIAESRLSVGLLFLWQGAVHALHNSAFNFKTVHQDNSLTLHTVFEARQLNRMRVIWGSGDFSMENLLTM